MAAIPVIAIFDAGKTNKKVFLFDQQYRVVYDKSTRLPETTDEDGYPCEDVHALSAWVRNTLTELLTDERYDIRAVNFTSYGASFVHVDEQLAPVLPLYNYLKPYPHDIKQRFFERYGGEIKISRETASPVLDHLNSGLLLYRLKEEKRFPVQTHFSVHLPQYLSSLVTRQALSDITSIGCHTMLWNFEMNSYHEWVANAGIGKMLPPIFPSDSVLEISTNEKQFFCGIGLHDSSSALIPYLATVEDPFVLISTGTWSITMNPFNDTPLLESELTQDCLCYLTYKGFPVKSSRLFAGHMHEEGVNKLNAHFLKDPQFFRTLKFDRQLADAVGIEYNVQELQPSDFPTYESAYHALVGNIIRQQVKSSNLVLTQEVKRIFVDGGFSSNEIFMRLLARAYPDISVFAASVAQATAMGAALAIHDHWNAEPISDRLVELVPY